MSWAMVGWVVIPCGWVVIACIEINFELDSKILMKPPNQNRNYGVSACLRFENVSYFKNQFRVPMNKLLLCNKSTYGPAPHMDWAHIHIPPHLYFHPRFV